MDDSIAQPSHRLAPMELPGWKTALGWLSAILIGLLFLASGIWKITDVNGAAVRMAQAKVPEFLSQAAALVFGILETVAGVWIIVPRFRRWGALLASVLLVAFVIYIGIHYNALRGEECSCFPWLKRAVGPAFFIGDGLMIVAAVCAGIWARRPGSIRSAMVVFSAVVVFALVSYGVESARQKGTRAPDTITVDGKPYALSQGKYFLYFFNPMCSHCSEAAKKMSQLSWGDTRVVAVPVEVPEFSAQFLAETGLHAVVSSDFSSLKDTFNYKAYPFGVALVNGVSKGALTQFDGEEPAATLRKLGLVR